MLAELRRKRRVPARLLGVGLTGLVASSATSQLGLFAEPVAGETERERTVSRTVDELRNRFGREAVMPGRLVEDDHAPRVPKGDAK